jgi:hypothetical protein
MQKARLMKKYLPETRKGVLVMNDIQFDERTMRDIASALYSREKAGQERGEKIGQERGDKTGRQALSILLQKLLEEGRKEEFDRVLRDNEYQEKLLREYHLK